MGTIISQQSYTIFTHLTHPTPLNNVKAGKIFFTNDYWPPLAFRQENQLIRYMTRTNLHYISAFFFYFMHHVSAFFLSLHQKYNDYGYFAY